MTVAMMAHATAMHGRWLNVVSETTIVTSGFSVDNWKHMRRNALMYGGHDKMLYNTMEGDNSEIEVIREVAD